MPRDTGAPRDRNRLIPRILPGTLHETVIGQAGFCCSAAIHLVFQQAGFHNAGKHLCFIRDVLLLA